MDEMEKKELESAETALPDCDSVKASEDSGAQELVKELEEIRDMFQEALDNAVAEDEQEIIQELEDEVDECGEEVESEPERPVCECCGEERASKYYGEDYPYCDNCRELMKRYPLRIGGVIAIIAMIVAFGASVYLGSQNVEKAITILDAQSNAQQGKVVSVLDSLYSYISDSDPDSKKIQNLLIDSFCRAGYISDAKTYIENIYTNRELEKASNKKYKAIVDKVDAFVATQEETQQIVYSPFRGAEFDYEEVAAELDKVKNSFINEEEGIKYESALTEYYKAELMRLKGMELEQQFEVLKGIEDADTDGFYGWIYLTSLCELAGRMGNKELAEDYFEKAKKNNSEDMAAYKAMASYYRFLEIPDGDSIVELCNEAEKNARAGDTSFNRILAVAYLIKGEGALAYEAMTEYMSYNNYSAPDCNLYALCALYCGNTETYEKMKTVLGNAGYSLSDLVEKYKNGEMSVEQVLADKGGDIG